MTDDLGRPSTIAVGRALPANSAPIFLTGFARSGTTWVNRLMRDYFDSGFVNEGQFIISFGKRIQRYGDLQNVRNRERLLRDVGKDRFFSILSANYGVNVDWGRVLKKAGSFSGAVTDILSQIAEQTNNHRIGSKYPAFGWHRDLLNDLFPDCRVIHVIRDGRDCALSHRHMTWGHQNTYSAALHWGAYIQTIRRNAETMRHRYLEVRYENLLLEPETTMCTLEHFITGTREYGATKRFIEGCSLLKTDRVGRWQQAMPERAQAIFEFVAGDALERCGYPLTGLVHRPSLLSRMGYVLHDRVTREGWNIARKVFRAVPESK